MISAKNDGAEPEQPAGTGIVRSNGETMGAEVCSLAHFFRWLASAQCNTNAALAVANVAGVG